MTRQKVRDFITVYLQHIAAERGTSIGLIDDAFDLVASGIIDSMSFVDLIASLEREFGVQLDLSDIDVDELTVGGLIRQIAPIEVQNDAFGTVPENRS